MKYADFKLAGFNFGLICSLTKEANQNKSTA
jgi:hypothetical protein